MMSEPSAKAQEALVKSLVTSSVREAIGDLADRLRDDLRDDLSRQVEDRLQSVTKAGTEQPPTSITGTPTSSSTYTSLSGSLPTGTRAPALGGSSQLVGTSLSALGGSGLTPSGDGSLPAGFSLSGLNTFSAGGTLSSLPHELPLSAFMPSATNGPAATEGVVVGHLSPPVPWKLAQKIWRGEFVDLNLLLPHRLGAPEPTLADALQNKQRETKQISSIEHWMVCFNAYISVVALHYPERVRDLLAYASLIAKAAYDYEGTPWLSYDTHFRTLAASMRLQSWGAVDQSLWSQHFNRATLRASNSGALAIGPYQADTAPVGGKARTSSWTRPKERSRPYGRSPICVKWNRDGCRSAVCGFRHVCLDCHGLHKEIDCPSAKRQKLQPFRRDGGQAK